MQDKKEWWYICKTIFSNNKYEYQNNSIILSEIACIIYLILCGFFSKLINRCNFFPINGFPELGI